MGTPEIIMMSISCSILLLFFLAWFFSNRARHRETMAMIEKGMNPNEFRGIDRWRFALRKFSVLLLGLGTGSVLFWALDSAEVRSVNTDAGTLTVFALGVGGALFLDQRYGTKKED